MNRWLVILPFTALIEIYYHVDVIDSYLFATLSFLLIALASLFFARWQNDTYLRGFSAFLIGGIVSMLITTTKTDIMPIQCNYTQFGALAFISCVLEFIYFENN